jgi:aldehyde reductase
MQKPLFEFCKLNNISFTCFASLGSPERPFAKADEPVLLKEPQLKAIADAHQKTPAQVLQVFF